MVLDSWIFLFFAITFPLLHLLGLISAVDALLFSRSSQGAIAWCLFLIGFPYMGLPIYWIFGRAKFHGYSERIQRVAQHQSANIEWYRNHIVQYGSLPPDPVPHRAEGFQSLSGTTFLGGNDTKLLIDGEETFKAIFEALDSASSYLLIQFFIIKDDEIGRAFQRKACDAAARGVKVYVLYDEVGSHTLSRRYLSTLRASGVQVSSFGTRRGPRNFFQVNFRNHRKIVVVDGQTAFVGGHNVGDEYLGRSKRFGHWRDTHMRVSGPAVMHLKASFASDWVWATGEVPNIDQIAPKIAGDAHALTVSSGPADPKDKCLLFFLHCVSSAKSRVWIASPYFVPDDALLSALQLAALRGVDVRVIIPSVRDHTLVWLASFFFAPEAAGYGIKVYRYRAGFLHEKVVLVDDTYASIGSANFDNRSFRLNFETTTLISSASFAQKVAEMLQEDMKHCDEVSHLRHADISAWKRLGARFARLFSPIL